MNSADNPKLNYIALKLALVRVRSKKWKIVKYERLFIQFEILVKVAIPWTLNTAISSGQGDAFCHEYDQYDNTKLTQEQVLRQKLIFI